MTSIRTGESKLTIFLTRSLGDYYEEYVHRIVKGANLLDIDEKEFAETGSAKELLKMAVLVVGDAFLGRTQKRFITGITALNPEVQSSVIAAIKIVIENTEDIATPISPIEVLPSSNNSGTIGRSDENCGGELDSLAKKEGKSCLEGHLIGTETEMELLKRTIDALTKENEDLKSKMLVLREKVKPSSEQDMLLEDERRKIKTLRAEMDFYKALSEERTRESHSLAMKVVELEQGLSAAKNRLAATEVRIKSLVQERILLGNGAAHQLEGLSDDAPPRLIPCRFLEKPSPRVRRRCAECYKRLAEDVSSMLEVVLEERLPGAVSVSSQFV
ncbi:hypothetical protein KIN20_026800 [Parelaphostrongylus tenuis]|uniref:HOOK N-terminal domain-containing protein n=1 Tax=Parelaphostrongylus tenuis TaxID=148309 RepID=A0AAD5WD42_PARTN|nr:hypothetical protein KIN20_026800 [Parelaphostrongylus tenuis]